MAMKSGNLLIKLVVLLAVAGAVFFALDSWRQKSATSSLAPEAEMPASTDSPSGAALSVEEAERIGTEVGTRIGTEIGTQIGLEIAAQMLAEREARKAAAAPAEPAVVASKPAKAPAPVAEPAADQEAQPAEAEATATEPAPMPVDDAEPAQTVASKPREVRTQGTIPGTPIAQPSTGRDSWWTKSNTGAPDALFLTYVGNFTSTDGSLKGIALMFSGKFDKQTDFASSISVSGGSDVSGQWQLGASPGLIFLPGIPAGDYTVSVKAGLTDKEGKSFKNDISGPVTVE